MNFSDFVVRNDDGSINEASTLQRVSVALSGWVVEENRNQEDLVKSLDSIFDANEENKRISLQSLVLVTLQRNGKDVTDTKELTAMKVRIAKLVEVHPRFDTSVGRGGGVRRNALPAGRVAAASVSESNESEEDSPEHDGDDDSEAAE